MNAINFRLTMLSNVLFWCILKPVEPKDICRFKKRENLRNIEYVGK